MGKFNKTGKRGMPELNTSSLPDLIFTMLFFFMIVTTMREVTLKVQFQVPQGTELEKLEKKSLVSFIYIGKPLPVLNGGKRLCSELANAAGKVVEKIFHVVRVEVRP